jgi:hypothetical protein
LNRKQKENTTGAYTQPLSLAPTHTLFLKKKKESMRRKKTPKPIGASK